MAGFERFVGKQSDLIVTLPGVRPKPLPRRTLLAYSEDQPRDEHGRWTESGGILRDPVVGEPAPHPLDAATQAWGASLTEEERTALADYQHGLRGQNDAIDSAIAKSHIEQSVYVYDTLPRGMVADTQVGDVLHPAGYLNTTADNRLPQEGYPVGVVVPEGSHGAWLDANPDSPRPDALELLLPRGTTYTVEGRVGGMLQMRASTPDSHEHQLAASAFRTRRVLLAYSEDQPRDERGRWSPSEGHAPPLSEEDKQKVSDSLNEWGEATPAYKEIEGIFGDHLHVTDAGSERVQRNIEDLAKVPEPILEKLNDSGLQIYAGAKPIYELDDAQPLAQWSNKDDVIGVYNNEANKLALSDLASPAQDTSTAIHETGHAVQAQLMTTDQVAELHDWNYQLYDNLSPYEGGGGPGDRSAKEMWGETFSAYIRGGEDAVEARYHDADYAAWTKKLVEGLK